MKKLALVLLICSVSAAAANAAIPPNAKEFSIFGIYSHTPVKGLGSSDAGGVGIGVSQFMNNEVSVGLQGWTNWGNDGDMADVGVNAKYHFCPMEAVTPYVGGQLNYAYATSTAWSNHLDGAMYGPLAGLRFDVADKTSLFVEYQWQLYSGEIRQMATESSAIFMGITYGF